LSSPYYTRLEQGRDRHPSPQILDAIGRALGLDEQARAHLHRLAQAAAATPRSPAAPKPAPDPQEVAPSLRRLLDSWTAQPAVIVGRYRDVLAANRLARLLNRGFEPGSNLLRHVFLDPDGRRCYLDWAEIAEGAVAGLRASAGAEPDDPRLASLVRELSAGSGEFQDLWSRHDVRARVTGRKRYRHPVARVITLDYETFTVNADPDQILFVFQAEPGGRDEDALLRLGACEEPAS
jgi:hypothetical protein